MSAQMPPSYSASIDSPLGDRWRADRICDSELLLPLEFGANVCTGVGAEEQGGRGIGFPGIDCGTMDGRMMEESLVRVDHASTAEGAEADVGALEGAMAGAAGLSHCPHLDANADPARGCRDFR